MVVFVLIGCVGWWRENKGGIGALGEKPRGIGADPAEIHPGNGHAEASPKTRQSPGRRLARFESGISKNATPNATGCAAASVAGFDSDSHEAQMLSMRARVFAPMRRTAEPSR